MELVRDDKTRRLLNLPPSRHYRSSISLLHPPPFLSFLQLTKSTGTNPAGQIRGCTECPAGYITSPCGRKCVLAPSQANYPAYKAKRAAEKKDDALCPKGLDACAISTSGLTGGYEVSWRDGDKTAHTARRGCVRHLRRTLFDEAKE